MSIPIPLIAQILETGITIFKDGFGKDNLVKDKLTWLAGYPGLGLALYAATTMPDSPELTDWIVLSVSILVGTAAFFIRHVKSDDKQQGIQTD